MKELSIEEKAKAYDEALKVLHKYDGANIMFTQDLKEEMFPELKESEDEKVRKELIKHLKEGAEGYMPAGGSSDYQRWLAWVEKQKEPLDKGEISDGYHTFNELYYYRMLYNAAFFNLLPKEWVHKSRKHHTGEECFGGGWFIVMAELPTGQISNHYEMKDWDLFDIPEKDVANEWDGHTPQEAAERLHNYLLEKQGGQKSAELDGEGKTKLMRKCVHKAYQRGYETGSMMTVNKIIHEQEWSEDDNLYYDDICEILMNLLHSERTSINKDAVQKDLDWLGHIKEKTQRNKEDATADEIINYFKCQTRDEPSRKDTHNKWISWIKNRK